jgi:hypothetical protein
MSESYGVQQLAFSPFGLVILLAGAVLAAIVIGAGVYLAVSRKLSLRAVAASILAWLWVLPVAAVLVYVLIRGVGPSGSTPPVADEEAVELGESATGEDFAAAVKPSAADDHAALPAWVRQGRVENGSNTLLVLKSQQFATVEEAERQVLDEAVRQVRLDFHQEYPDEGAWTVPMELVRNQAIRQRYVQPISRQSGNVTFDVHRVYLQVELSPALRGELYPVWRRQIVAGRLWTLGSLLGVVTLVLGTSAAYLRLDSLTRGLYRGRLKLAAASLIVAGGVAAATLLKV